MKLQYILALNFLFASNGYSALLKLRRPLTQFVPVVVQPIEPLRALHTYPTPRSYVSLRTTSGETSKAIADSLFSLPGMDGSKTRILLGYCFSNTNVASVTIESTNGDIHTVMRPLQPNQKNLVDTDWSTRSERSTLHRLLIAGNRHESHQAITIKFYESEEKVIINWDNLMEKTFYDREE